MFKYGNLIPLYRNEISIKQNDRVKQYGEVFTPSNIVIDMLDLIPRLENGNIKQSEDDKIGIPYLSSTFLEPSCGDGNFLAEILNRKLNCVSLSCIDHDVLLAVSSIYGVDIQADNVLESRRRLFGILVKFYENKGLTMSSDIEDKICELLYNNIILGNTIDDKMLKLDNNGNLLDFRTNEVLMQIVSDTGRFDTMCVLTNSDATYGNSDIYNWCKQLGQDVSPEFCSKITQYFRDNRTNRLACYSWTISESCELNGVSEFLIENEEPKKIEPVKVNTTFSADFLAGLNFGK